LIIIDNNIQYLPIIADIGGVKPAWLIIAGWPAGGRKKVPRAEKFAALGSLGLNPPERVKLLVLWNGFYYI